MIWGKPTKTSLSIFRTPLPTNLSYCIKQDGFLLNFETNLSQMKYLSCEYVKPMLSMNNGSKSNPQIVFSELGLVNFAIKIFESARVFISTAHTPRKRSLTRVYRSLLKFF